MATTLDQIDLWLTEPEGTNLEFKEARNNYDLGKLLRYCVALANEGGGKFILGVSDERPRTIVGTSAFPELRREQAIHKIGATRAARWLPGPTNPDCNQEASPR